MFRALASVVSFMLAALASLLLLCLLIANPGLRAQPAQTGWAPPSAAVQTLAAPAIQISATVGSDPHSCATGQTITTTAGTTVTSCYTVTTRGGITFNAHTDSDTP